MTTFPKEGAGADEKPFGADGGRVPHVLLVEDYPANILVATSILDILGATYDVARNGVEAIEKVKQKTFDLVLMDIQMPEMDGFAATRAIRDYEAGKGVRTAIMGVTAHALRDDRDKCLTAGMDDYISKPFSFEGLAEKIRRWMPK